VLRKKEAEEVLRRAESIGVLNIQPLAIRLSSHSPSSLECEEGKTYNEKIQFAHSIIQDIYKTETSTVKFLCKRKKGWSLSVQTRLRATSMDLMNIEKYEEDKGVEQ
jgi:hypothetical protein